MKWKMFINTTVYSCCKCVSTQCWVHCICCVCKKTYFLWLRSEIIYYICECLRTYLNILSLFSHTKSHTANATVIYFFYHHANSYCVNDQHEMKWQQMEKKGKTQHIHHTYVCICVCVLRALCSEKTWKKSRHFNRHRIHKYSRTTSNSHRPRLFTVVHILKNKHAQTQIHRVQTVCPLAGQRSMQVRLFVCIHWTCI